LSYLLDTNACIAIINGRPPTVRRRLREVLESGERVAVSSIAVFELWYGVAKSTRVEANTERLALFLGQFEVVAFDDADAHAAGIVRARLEQSGTPIGAYDTLIAGQAICHGMILVTANLAEFDRVPGLRPENWATPRPH
jgi:tRNA(fMet)-specific endonuclease VapC